MKPTKFPAREWLLTQVAEEAVAAIRALIGKEST